MNLEGKRVTVVGTGVSGIGSATLLDKVGAVITMYDGSDKADRAVIEEKLKAAGVKSDVRYVFGDTAALFDTTDLAVISPGVPIDSEIVLAFKERQIPVWGEIELAYNYEKGTVYAITGTNGKTTTTTLVGEIMKKHNPETFVVGNIGISYTGEALKTSEKSITVAEISSFQLESTIDFAPKGTAILNITPDHLNRHYTLDNYIQVKESITKNEPEDGFCVLNYDDEALRAFGEKRIKEGRGKTIWFSRNVKKLPGAYLDGDCIFYGKSKEDVQKVMSTSEMFLFGNHNYENVMAAICIASEAGVPMETIVSVIRAFRGVEHRIEWVRDLDGVTYYNDSKGTNPDSSIKALQAMSRPTLLIAGGYDKKSEFDGFIEAFDGKVKMMALIGTTADKIEECARKHGFTNIVRCADLKEATIACRDAAESGDVVLLSPACASWDQFTGYEERGRLFKQYVNEFMDAKQSTKLR